MDQIPELLTSAELLLPQRRQFLRAAAVLPAMALLPGACLANDFWNRPRELWLKRSGTNEEVRAIYWADGKLVPDGYVALCTLLRDVRSGDAVQMDIVLLDILRGVYGWFEAANITRPININSGYRSANTNNQIEGAAKNSMHLYAKAADLRMDGVPTEYLGRLGKYLSGGGVGFYLQKNFVHVDSGRLRSWVG